MKLMIAALAAVVALPAVAAAQSAPDAGGYYRRYPQPAQNAPAPGQSDSFAIDTQPPAQAQPSLPQPPQAQPYPGNQYPSQYSQPYPPQQQAQQQSGVWYSDPYDPVQLLDGWGAMFVALGEPIVFRPATRVKDCLNASTGGARVAAAPFCGLYGVAEGLVFAVMDVTVGLGDIVTGGYFKLSRRAGVFDYFK